MGNREKQQYGTNFVESEIILAAGQGDWITVDLHLEQMLPNELKAFEKTIDHLQDRVWIELDM